MSKDINVDRPTLELFASLPPDPTILAFDPASWSPESSNKDRTGWSLFVGLFRMGHGDGTPHGAVDDALGAVCGRRVDVVVVEQPFRIAFGDQWRLADAYGVIRGYLHGRMGQGLLGPKPMRPPVETRLWTPKPPSWRAVVELNADEDGRRDRNSLARETARFCSTRFYEEKLGDDEDHRSPGYVARNFSYWLARKDAAAACAMGYAAALVARSASGRQGG